METFSVVHFLSDFFLFYSVLTRIASIELLVNMYLGLQINMSILGNYVHIFFFLKQIIMLHFSIHQVLSTILHTWHKTVYLEQILKCTHCHG